jgi:hypothetical protein
MVHTARATPRNSDTATPAEKSNACEKASPATEATVPTSHATAKRPSYDVARSAEPVAIMIRKHKTTSTSKADLGRNN